MSSRYKAYAEYKNSGVDLLGDIPSHWTVDKFRYLFSLGRGLGITKANLQDLGIPCVNYGEIHSKYGFEVSPDTHPLRCVSELYLESSSNSLLSNGDCVFADTSEDIEGAGNFTQLTSDQALFAGYHTVIARPKGENDARFLAYVFDSPAYRTQIRLAVKGVKVFSITQEILKNTDLWLAPIPEQKQIAHFLDHETAKIDLLIAKQQALIALLKEKRQAVISHAVTKGLNPNAKMKDSGVEWLGQVPEHWEVCLFKYKCCQITDGAHISPITEGGVYDFVSIRDIKKGVIDFESSLKTDPKSFQHMMASGCSPKPGDILFSKDGTIGETAITPEREIDFVVASSLIIIRPDQTEVLPEYLDFLLQSEIVKEQVESFVKGAALRRLSIQNLLKIGGVFPPIAEQLKVVECLKKSSREYDKLQLQAVRIVDLLQERRTALISAAVTGKIDVRDWTAPEEKESEVCA